MRTSRAARTTRPRRALVLTATVLSATALLATGCSSSGGSGTPKAADSNAKITLTVGDFGTFGYKEAGLFDAYTALHPNITIKEDTTTSEADYWTALQTHLSGASGLDDVQALEVGRISLATSDALSSAFQDLSKAPGVKQGDYLPWKWQQATTASGKTVGLGTDVGPMAVCYRQDLFAAAGLPSDPAAVSALWAGDWSKYVAVGKQFQAKAPKGTSFMDSATGLFNAVVSSSTQQYYASGKLAYKTSASVKSAWDLAMQADAAGTSQGLKEFDTPGRPPSPSRPSPPPSAPPGSRPTSRSTPAPPTRASGTSPRPPPPETGAAPSSPCPPPERTPPPPPTWSPGSPPPSSRPRSSRRSATSPPTRAPTPWPESPTSRTPTSARTRLPARSSPPRQGHPARRDRPARRRAAERLLQRHPARRAEPQERHRRLELHRPDDRQHHPVTIRYLGAADHPSAAPAGPPADPGRPGNAVPFHGR